MAESKGRKAAKDAALRDIDSYQDTVTGLICFGHAVTWDDKNRCLKPNCCMAFGRRMNTSAANAIRPDDEVTPDLIASADGIAVVGEAKVSFHGTVESKEKELRQLMKYDDDLTGWKSADGKVVTHDVVLLVHYSRKGDTTDILEEAVKQKKLNFKRNFSAVCFMRTSQAAVAINFADLELGDDGFTLHVRRSKTDQTGRGRKIGIPYGQHEETCPVRAMLAWLRESGIERGAVFRKVNRHGDVEGERLTGDSVALIVKRSAKLAGINPKNLAGHSLRAGLATAAAIAGVDERAIQEQTGHKSLKVLRTYIRDGSIWRNNAAKKVRL